MKRGVCEVIDKQSPFIKDHVLAVFKPQGSNSDVRWLWADMVRRNRTLNTGLSIKNRDWELGGSGSSLDDVRY